jgi:multidrug efflux pump subunit AcrB
LLALTRLSVAKPLAVIAIFVAVAVAGVLSYASLPINLLPSVNIPVVTIITTYPGAGPTEVERLVTRVIEDAVASISDLDVMTSTSSEGSSIIALTFTDKANPDLIATTVERQVDSVIQNLPPEAQRPTVTKIDLSALPVMQLAVVSDTLPGTDLFNIADQALSPEFQKVNGVSQVSMIGGQKQEIQVAIDPYKLTGYGVSLAQLQSALGSDNLSAPAGTLQSGPKDYNLRVNALVDRPDDLAGIVVGGTAASPVHLRDVAAVSVTGQVPTGVTRVNGHPGVLLRLTQQNGANTTAIADSIKQVVPGAKIQVNVAGAEGSAQPVSVIIQGPDSTVLASLAGQLEQSFQVIPGLRDVTNSAAAALPELDIDVDRARAAQTGVSAQSIASAVRLAYSGVVATKYRQTDGQDLDVRLLLAPDVRTQVANLGQLPLQGTNGPVVLSQIATITDASTPSQIDRRDRHRQVTVAANLGDGVVLSQVTPAVQQAVSQLGLPPGYTTSQGGSARQQAQSFGQLGAALLISILLAYLLMAILYNSLVHPFVILFGLPLAFSGAIFATFLFHYTLNVFSMIGMILLVGLAIKNGILLVDRTNHNRARGMERRAALLEAGPARLRAILMTSLTIAASLTPTAFQLGEGADLRAPLAATVLGGVISSTALTLVVVPVVYTLLDGLTTRAANLGQLRLSPVRLGASGASSVVLGEQIGDGSSLRDETNGYSKPVGMPRDHEAAPPGARDRGDD